MKTAIVGGELGAVQLTPYTSQHSIIAMTGSYFVVMCSWLPADRKGRIMKIIEERGRNGSPASARGRNNPGG